VFLGLVCSGTFPAPVPALQAAGLFTLYVTKYCLYFVSGALAAAGVFLAYRALNRSHCSTWGKVSLGVAAVTVVVSAVMTVTALAMSPSAAHEVPWYTYLIDVVVSSGFRV
jgi:hypothetical protein